MRSVILRDKADGLRGLLICGKKIGISDRRWVVFGMFEISYVLLVD